eukprot:g3929.t1
MIKTFPTKLLLSLFTLAIVNDKNGSAFATTLSMGALKEASDVQLSIKPDADGVSQLGFFVYGATGADFVLRNDDKGSLELKSADKTVFKIVEKVSGIPPSKPVSSDASLLELDETNRIQTRQEEHEREVLSAIHKERESLIHQRDEKRHMMRHQSSRHLLEMDRELNSSKDGGNTVAQARRRLLMTPLGKPIPGTGAPAYNLAESISAKGKIQVSGNIASTSSGNVKICGSKQWKMLVHDDFQKNGVTDDEEGWKINGGDGDGGDAPTDTCSDNPHSKSDFFLGPFDEPVETAKSFLLPPHELVRIEARVHFIDKWEGQSVFMKVDGKIVWIDRHKWCTKLLMTMCEPKASRSDDGMTISACGQKNFPDRMSVKVVAQLAHTNNDMEVSFGSNLKENQDLASWGADDIKIFVK